MPAPRHMQTSAMLSLIIFVVLFLIAATFAVVFYVKSEDYRTQVSDIQSEMLKLASAREKPSKMVGKPPKSPKSRKEMSYLGAMDAYLDQMISAITGKVSEDTTAAAKVNDATIMINETIETLGEDALPTYGPEGIDLINTIKHLKATTDAAREKQISLQIQLNDLMDKFDVTVENFNIEKQRLIEEKNNFQKMADDVQGNFNELKEEMGLSTERQVQLYSDRLDRTKENLRQTNAELTQTQEDLKKTKESLDIAIATLDSIKARPDIEVAAHKADARIVSIDTQSNVVYLDIGSKDHVYPGLTFSVYNQNAPMPKDGKGKAEIEVFRIEKNISAARIISEADPILTQDIIANLIWDSETSNRFVVAGDFDFDRDGKVDYDGIDKIKQLIEHWGGRIVSEVTIETDFVILGKEPKPIARPTREETEIYPSMTRKYEESLQRVNIYNDTLKEANKFSIPVFNQKRFMYLTGYESLAAKTTPL